MFKIKKFAAVVATAVIAVSAMAASVGAYDGSFNGITTYTNKNFSDTKSITQDNTYKSNINVYYMYGASSAGRADLICNYVYGDDFGYKYATITYGDDTFGSITSGGVGGVKVKTTTGYIYPVAPSAVVYFGCCRATPDDADTKYEMEYTLTLSR